MKTQPSLSLQSFLGAAMGTMVEYYDYALFSIFMPIFAPIFFPAQSAYDSLVKGYVVIGLSMVVRPFGGLFFGYLGDRFGRRRALLSSMYGIAFATACIGFIPSCANIGIYATLLLVLAKALQIFCFGGEFNGAGIYVVEHAQNNREGLVASLLSASTLCGYLLASVVGVVATYSFMPQWSWRLAFMIGGFIGFLGILYRKHMMESPQFIEAKPEQHSFLQMLKTYPRELLAGIFIGGFSTVPITTVLTFINPVLLTKAYFTNHELMWVQSYLAISAVLTLLGVGLIADRTSPRFLLYSGCLALVLFAYPLLYAIDSGSYFLLIMAMTLLVMLNEVFLAPVHVYFKDLFQMQYRYRGSSLSFCFGLSLFGGLTPLVESYLYQRSHHFSALTPWLIFTGLGTAAAIRWAYKKPQVAAAAQVALRPLSSL